MADASLPNLSTVDPAAAAALVDALESSVSAADQSIAVSNAADTGGAAATTHVADSAAILASVKPLFLPDPDTSLTSVPDALLLKEGAVAELWPSVALSSLTKDAVGTSRDAAPTGAAAAAVIDAAPEDAADDLPNASITNCLSEEAAKNLVSSTCKSGSGSTPVELKDFIANDIDHLKMNNVVDIPLMNCIGSEDDISTCITSSSVGTASASCAFPPAKNISSNHLGSSDMTEILQNDSSVPSVSAQDSVISDGPAGKQEPEKNNGLQLESVVLPLVQSDNIVKATSEYSVAKPGESTEPNEAIVVSDGSSTKPDQEVEQRISINLGSTVADDAVKKNEELEEGHLSSSELLAAREQCKAVTSECDLSKQAPAAVISPTKVLDSSAPTEPVVQSLTIPNSIDCVELSKIFSETTNADVTTTTTTTTTSSSSSSSSILVKMEIDAHPFEKLTEGPVTRDTLSNDNQTNAKESSIKKEQTDAINTSISKVQSSKDEIDYMSSTDFEAEQSLCDELTIGLGSSNKSVESGYVKGIRNDCEIGSVKEGVAKTEAVDNFSKIEATTPKEVSSEMVDLVRDVCIENKKSKKSLASVSGDATVEESCKLEQENESKVGVKIEADIKLSSIVVERDEAGNIPLLDDKLAALEVGLFSDSELASTTKSDDLPVVSENKTESVSCANNSSTKTSNSPVNSKIVQIEQEPEIMLPKKDSLPTSADDSPQTAEENEVLEREEGKKIEEKMEEEEDREEEKQEEREEEKQEEREEEEQEEREEVPVVATTTTTDGNGGVLQTVVGGVLQTLDMSSLTVPPIQEQQLEDPEEQCSSEQLFAGVDEDLPLSANNQAQHVLESSADEADGIGGLVINSVVGAFGGTVEETDDGNKQLADISGAPAFISGTSMEKEVRQEDEEEEDACPPTADMPRSKRPRLEEAAESELTRPVLIKVRPVKQDYGLWDSEKLRNLLAEKGSVLLRLCAVEPMLGEEYDAPSDLMGVMLESVEDLGLGVHGNKSSSGGGLDVFSIGIDGSYQTGYSSYGGEADFVETEEVEESLDYDAAAHSPDWQGFETSSPPRHELHQPTRAVTAKNSNSTTAITTITSSSSSSVAVNSNREADINVKQQQQERVYDKGGEFSKQRTRKVSTSSAGEANDDIPHQQKENSEQEEGEDLPHRYLLYQDENKEKERQYQQHKQQLEERRQAMQGNKQGSLALSGNRVTPFTCAKCNKGFNKRKQYLKHLKTHLPLNECSHCAFRTRSKKQFDAHELRHKKANPLFECDLCQVKYSTSSLLRSHSGRIHGIFHCYHCSSVFNSFEERNQHMSISHGSKPPKRKKSSYGSYATADHLVEDDDAESILDSAATGLICEMCDKPCRSRALLRIHVAQHLNVDPSRLTDDLELISTTNVRVADDLVNEEDSEDEKVAYTPPQTNKKRRLEPVDGGSNAPPAEVPHLGSAAAAAVYTNPYQRYVNDPEVNLLARLRPASKNAVFSCARCNISLPDPTSFFLHAVTTHGFLEYDANCRRRDQADRVSVPCDDTDGGVKQSPAAAGGGASSMVSNPPQHRRRSSTPYSCKVCGLTFHTGAKYKKYRKHLRTHNKARQCGVCSFTSKLTYKIVAHQSRMHKQLIRCPSLCLKMFSSKEELTQHRREVHGLRVATVTVEPCAADAEATAAAPLGQSTDGNIVDQRNDENMV